MDVDLPAGELAHRLTMAGVEVGDVVQTGGWTGCVVGQVLEVGPHPQADLLRLCRVNAGIEVLEVVCGAPNVAVDQKICFAGVGAYLYNAHSGKHETLKAARIRGVESRGMICSELELGLSESHEGILVLPDDAPVGTPLDQYLGDTVLDLELTPNRLDCLSVLGVAHEVAALTGKTVREPGTGYPENGPPMSDQAAISVADPDLCPRYTASLIQGIKVGPSPEWLQERLSRAGLRPINNIVDVTNFVMLEFNQPLHAFDFETITDSTVIVRRAVKGETLQTLDGEERRLNSQVLVIADAARPVGMAGVIGGQNSEIGPDTTSVLLESANFNAANNRETATSMGLRTEATLRFEKGLRPELAPLALRRATALIQEVAGGAIAPGIIDVYPEPDAPLTVALTMRRLRQSLGMDLELEQAQSALELLGFTCTEEGESLIVAIPWWRNDVNIEDDLVEEVVRIIGYDAVPTVMLSTPIPFHSPSPAIALREEVRDLLAAGGMQEVINYSVASIDLIDRAVPSDSEAPPMRLANPMSATHEYLRPTLQAGLLANLAANQSQGPGPFRLFEAGRIFLPRSGDLPEEVELVTAALAGRRSVDSWHDTADGDGMDFYDAKGMVEWLLERLGIHAEWEPGEHPVYQPGRCAAVKALPPFPLPQGEDQDGGVLGYAGEIHPEIKERFGLDFGTVAGFELRLPSLLAALPDSERHFTTLPRFPAATRDLALIVAADVPAGRVTELIMRNRLVERAELFDIYSGDTLAPGTKSLAFHVHFQAADRTLTNEEVSRSLDGLLRTLEREAGATLRS